eukprot:sb/3470584/
MASFLFISLGYGLCKPNIAPFGADQIRGAGIETLQRYYHAFYILTNIGSIAAFAVSFLQTPRSKPPEYVFSTLVSPVCSLICFLLLICGSREFVKAKQAQDTFKTYFEIAKELGRLYYQIRDQPRHVKIGMLKATGGVNWGAEEVDAFLNLFGLFPPLFTMLIYWTCYSQVYEISVLLYSLPPPSQKEGYTVPKRCLYIPFQ